MRRLMFALIVNMLLLAFALFFSPNEVHASDALVDYSDEDLNATDRWYEEFDYTFDNGRAIVLNRYKGDEKVVAIPGMTEINGVMYSTHLGKGLFVSSGVESVSINGCAVADDCSYMFANCKDLKNVSLIGLNTSNVKNMNGMFSDCSNLANIDLTMLDFRQVETMSYMFYRCSSLKNVSFGEINTMSLVDMSGIFRGCGSLTGIDLSSFDTKNVTNMSYMFLDCGSLTNIDLSLVDMINVTDLSFMFTDCSSLTSVEFGDKNAKKIKNMRCMFCGCNNLKSIDLSSLDIGHVSDMAALFKGCDNLSLINMKGLILDDRANMRSAFEDCYNLKKIVMPQTVNSKAKSGEFPHSMYTADGTWYRYFYKAPGDVILRSNVDDFTDDETVLNYKGPAKEAGIITTTTDEYGKKILDRVKVTSYVVYNGKKHTVPALVKSKKYSGDIDVLMEGKILEFGKATYRFKNNKNVSGNGLPYLTIKFKAKKRATTEQRDMIKAINKELKSQKIEFKIKPVNINAVPIDSYKTNKKKTVLKSIVVRKGYSNLKLKKSDFDSYRSGKGFEVTGKGNYTGTVYIPLVND